MAGGKKIVVTVDAELKGLVPEYLENRRNDVAEIETALSLGEMEKIRILAHSMKGSGGGYGFDAITEIGGAMESAAKAGDAAKVRAENGRLADYLARVEVVY